MASMNRGLNLPAISRIMNEFEKESSMMDMKEDMMSEAVDDVMDEEMDEEEEGDAILKQVLDEIGVNLSQQVLSLIVASKIFIHLSQLTDAPTGLAAASDKLANRQPVALGDGGPAAPPRSGDDKNAGGDSGGGGGGGSLSDEDALQARLDALRRG
jgi:charged multivesicular body protein 2A